jgi:hypothetical protein
MKWEIQCVKCVIFFLIPDWTSSTETLLSRLKLLNRTKDVPTNPHEDFRAEPSRAEPYLIIRTWISTPDSSQLGLKFVFLYENPFVLTLLSGQTPKSNPKSHLKSKSKSKSHTQSRSQAQIQIEILKN